MPRRIFIALILTCLLAGCGRIPSADTAGEPPASTPIVHVITVTPGPQEAAAEQSLPDAAEVAVAFSARENRAGELVFDLPAEDYIAAFNQAWGEEYLPGLDQWAKETHPAAPHVDHETDVYKFRRGTVSSLPEMRLYVPTDGGCVQEIMLALDHHGYTDWGYEMFQEQCLIALKLLLPDSSETRRMELFQTLYLLGERGEDSYIGPEPWTDITPPVLYRQGDVGLYPCYGDGLLCICAIPVTEGYVDALTEQGIDVYEIPTGGDQTCMN